MQLALDAWSVGSLPPREDGSDEIPAHETLLQHRTEELKSATIEACILERSGASAIRFRSIAGEELKELAAA
jgi:hypothetical protein